MGFRHRDFSRGFLFLSTLPVLLTAAGGCTSLLGTFEVAESKADAGATTDAGAEPDTGGAVDSAVPPTDASDAGPPPVFVASFVAAGLNHTCAVKPPGHVYCWGNNDHGQLGVPPALTPGTKSNKPIKVPNFGAGVGSGKPIVKVFVGAAHTCALDEIGALFCWGSNDSKQLGTGDPPDAVAHDNPRRVKGVVGVTLDGVASASLGAKHSCAVLSTGDVACWGSNADGQIGVTGTLPVDPTKVPTVNKATLVTVGARHSCALAAATAQVWCWGISKTGQLGIGSMAAPVAPTPVNFGTESPNFLGAGGEGHSCATVGGPPRLQCFGANDVGQLGAPGTIDNPVPTNVAVPVGAPSFDEVQTGGKFSCAKSIATGGPNSAALGCWGANNHGQLGLGTVDPGRHDIITSVPGQIATVLNYSVGAEHACAIIKTPADPKSGPVFCWGGGAFGKLGVDLGGTSDQPNPRAVLVE